MVHTGTTRYKSPEVFTNYDVIITTYGISRIDIELLKSFFFDYVILDESQNIKNPSSKSFQAVKQLKSRFKLILSGTPVENSVNDLWTQMSFINPGLQLGATIFPERVCGTHRKEKKDEEKSPQATGIDKAIRFAPYQRAGCARVAAKNRKPVLLPDGRGTSLGI